MLHPVAAVVVAYGFPSLVASALTAIVALVTAVCQLARPTPRNPSPVVRRARAVTNVARHDRLVVVIRP